MKVLISPYDNKDFDYLLLFLLLLLLKMNRNYRDGSASAEITLNYVNGLLAVEGDDQQDRNVALQDALSYCYSFLMQKKVEWSIYVEKLAELFLELAFETQKHAKIKEVLKQYRAITQNQHPESLRHILEYFRDNKIQTILDEQIPEDTLDFIKKMKNIQDDEASSEIILSSFNPEVKNQRQKIREKLKIVWEGYKAIIDTVRLNQKLQTVYKVTLKRIFEFVDKYNRKGEFKNFCEYLRTGLKIALNKRDKTQQQKGFYIDIEKQQVNTNNIEIRLDQFTVTTKLGLWQEAFQILEDIKQLIRVRKGPVKNAVKCSYFQKLALIFRKSNYWHYHAYALYNYYSIYITKSKLASEQRYKLADKLLLSVLCIPPSTLESHQSKQNQQKIGQMMIYGTKIPDREQLHDMMVSRGIVQNASKDIKDLWYFMFLEFDLSSLKKGLELLKKLEAKADYLEYVPLLEDILIYKQLISVAEVYQKMKYDSLMNLLQPLHRSKIQKILLECHQRKVIDFILDEKKGIISFQEKNDEANPLEEFYHSFIEIALLREETRQMDRKFILKKSKQFMQDSDNYYWKIRQYEIDEYDKKLKKPKEQLTFKEREGERKKKEQKERLENERRIREAEMALQQERKKEELITKKIIIDDIIKIKDQRIVRLHNKKIEALTNQQIQQIEVEKFEELLKETENRVSNNNENRNKKKFLKVDYLERERREIIKQKIVKQCEGDQKEQEALIKQNVRKDFEEKQALKTMISKVAPEVKQTIDFYYKESFEKYEKDMTDFKKRLEDEFRIKIWKKAQELYQINEQNKRAQEKRRREEQTEQANQMWGFRPIASIPTTSAENTNDTWTRKQKTQKEQEQKPVTTQLKKPKDTGSAWGRKQTKSQNVFESLQVTDEPEQKKQTKDKNDAWGFKKKEDKPQEGQKKFQPPAANKFVAEPAGEKKGAWGKSIGTEQTKPKASEGVYKPPAPAGEKKKGKGW